MLPKGERGFGALLVIVLISIVIIVGFWFLKNNKNTSLDISTLQSTPSATPNPWKTYTNTQYNISVTYPSTGVVLNSDGQASLGACGNSIKVDTSSGALNNITLDNFFGIKVIPYTGTIAEYMRSQGATHKYNINVIQGTGADEAIALNGLRPGVEYARGYPPLAYVSALYKKGDQLYLMKTFQNPENVGGCIAPNYVDPVKYYTIATSNWNMPASLKFVNGAKGPVGLANPASVNCEKVGGKTQIVTGAGGAEYGICIFANNMQCEEWALFRNECPVGGVKVTKSDTNEKTFCEISGGQTTTNRGAVCSFPDGSICGLDALYNGKCRQGI